MDLISLVYRKTLEKLYMLKMGVRGVSISSEIGSGYSKKKEETDMRNKLEDVARRVVGDPKYQSKDTDNDGNKETFCNLALNEICAEVFNYVKFKGLLANQIHCQLSEDKEWKKDSPIRAQEMANIGGLAIAAWKNPNGHGHVAIIFPGNLVHSDKWGSDAPMTASVGNSNKIAGANFCFSAEPDYFLHIA